jgi:hypothetical protein
MAATVVSAFSKRPRADVQNTPMICRPTCKISLQIAVTEFYETLRVL